MATSRRSFLALLASVPLLRRGQAHSRPLPPTTEYHWSDCYANFDGPCDCDRVPRDTTGARWLPKRDDGVRADTYGEDDLVPMRAATPPRDGGWM